jgi:acetoin utilization deacetylase AcuC-like enzyme
MSSSFFTSGSPGSSASTARGTDSSRPPRSGPEAGPKALLLIDDPAFDAHRPTGYHPERPERLVAARAALASSDASVRTVTAREASREELERVHTGAYLDALEALRGQTAQLDPDTYVSPRSVEAARRAAGGLIELVDAVLEGPTSKGLALLRPPGHHARAARGMGFCLLNNVAAAAAHARARGVSRVLVVDWDVHHGNGTQEMFWRDPHVLYMSTHQYPFYPGTGAAEERGEGDGRGYTVNVPLLAGGGDGVDRAAFERVLLPIVESYAPELVLVSAGFDSAVRDPLASMELSPTAFGWMAAALAKAADRSAKGRMLMALEGGYDLPSLEAGLGAAIDGMLSGEGVELARDPDAADVARAAAAARETWRGVS